jgi:predicted component of type VI protein secretion system
VSREPVKTKGKPSRPPAVLEVEEAGKFFIEDSATIGRVADIEITLDIRSVSRHHARIFYEGGRYWLKDLDSANGTTVNGSRIHLQMLDDGDRVCFGGAKSIFHDSAKHSGDAAPAHEDRPDDDAPQRDETPRDAASGSAISADFDPERVRRLEQELAALRGMVKAKDGELQSLRAELGDVRAGTMSTELLSRTTNAGLTAPAAPDVLARENEQLRRMVTRLERALAEGNMRSRMLQDRLDGMTQSVPPSKDRRND